MAQVFLFLLSLSCFFLGGGQVCRELHARDTYRFEVPLPGLRLRWKQLPEGREGSHQDSRKERLQDGRSQGQDDCRVVSSLQTGNGRHARSDRTRAYRQAHQGWRYSSSL